MKKCMTLLLVFLMAFSLLTVPVCAEETSPIIWQDKIDAIPDNTNIFYESSSSNKPTTGGPYDKNGGFMVSLQANNNSFKSSRFGTFDATTKAIKTLPQAFGWKNATDTLEHRYANGEQFVIGSALGTTYTSNSTTTGYHIDGQPMRGAALTKVKDPENDDNNVLKFDFGQTGKNKSSLGGYQSIHIRLKGGVEEPITVNDGTNHTAKGKMVYEWKVRVPADSIPLFPKKNSTHIYLGGVMASKGYTRLLGDAAYAAKNSAGDYELKVEYNVTDAETGTVASKPSVTIDADTWYSFMQVITVDETALTTGRPLVDLYVNGQKLGTYRPANADNAMIGSADAGWSVGQWWAGLGPDISSASSAQIKKNMIVYYDDINQYWISDTLTVSGIADSYADFSSKDKIEVKYSNPADFVALEDAISVTKDGAAAEGVTVTVTPQDEYTAYISLAGLDTGSTYNVTISEFADTFGNKAASKTFTVTTATEYGYSGEYIINDDFEDSVKDKNWLETSSAITSGWGVSWRHNQYGRGKYAKNSSGVYSFQDGSCNRCTETDYADNYLTDYFIGVVADPKDSDNNVIKYQAGKNGDGVHYARAYYKLDKDVDTTKNVVLSSKILLTESLKNYISESDYADLPVMYTYNQDNDGFTRAKITATSSGITLTAAGGFTTNLKTDEWFELKYVILPTTTKTETKDENGNVTEVAYDKWTYMVYINDVLVDVDEKTVFTGNSSTQTIDGVKYSGGFVVTNNTGLEMGGVSFGMFPYKNGDKTPTFYVDDVKFYQPEKLSAALTQSGKTVSIALNNQVSKNAIKNIMLRDLDGNVVENGLLSATTSKDYKTVILTVNEDAVLTSTKYYVDGIYDLCGQLPTSDISFVTPKSYGLYIDSVTDVDTSASGKVKATVKIVNAKGEELPALIAVTVYSSKKEMIGMYATEFANLGILGYEDEITVDIGNHQASEIECIKVHLWDGLATQAPYQMAEKVVY